LENEILGVDILASVDYVSEFAVSLFEEIEVASVVILVIFDSG